MTQPFPIQELTIPPALAGLDVCGKAKTGSGKTLAFALPVVQRSEKTEPRSARSLVLVPTRELACQVRAVLAPLAAQRHLRVAAIYGGASIDPQIAAIRRGVDIVVATPGRLIDLGDRGNLSISDVGLLVLDEADRMADMGFLPQVEWVLRRLGPRRQTLLFSATLDRTVDDLVRRYLRHPSRVEVASEEPTVAAMAHRFLRVHELDKAKVVAAIGGGVARTLVFVRTRRGADRLGRQLADAGVDVGVLHGGLTQSAREQALRRFTAAEVPMLIATDVAARGLDVEGVDVVVHYDPPEDDKAYLHRSGRTARAGETGVAASLLLWNQVVDAERLQRRLQLLPHIVEVLSNDPRLADLLGWEPEPLALAATGTEGRPRPAPARRRRRR